MPLYLCLHVPLKFLQSLYYFPLWCVITLILFFDSSVFDDHEVRNLSFRIFVRIFCFKRLIIKVKRKVLANTLSEFLRLVVSARFLRTRFLYRLLRSFPRESRRFSEMRREVGFFHFASARPKVRFSRNSELLHKRELATGNVSISRQVVELIFPAVCT